MNKKFFPVIFIFFLSFFANSQSIKDIYFQNLFNSLYNCIDIFSHDTSLITGLYSANGILKGSATIGNFPSFRAGTSIGVILYTNPIRFLKNISFSNNSWDDIKNNSGFKTSFDWFDNYCIPIPVTNYYFEMGLPHGMSIGNSFFVSNYSGFVNAVSSATSTYLKNFFLWGLGINFNYTILKEFKFFPSISTGFGVNYSDSNFTLNNYSVGNTFIDPSNQQIPTYLGFTSHSYNTTFSFDLTLSKLIYFFEPFLNLKFAQSVCYNVSEFLINLDLTNATQSAKDIYGDGKYQISNLKVRYGSAYPIGDIIPASDLILNAGFEFVATIFRMGFQASFSCVSQKCMLLVDMRFHVEDWQFKKLKKEKN